MKHLLAAVLTLSLLGVPLAVRADGVDELVEYGTRAAIDNEVDPYLVAHVWWFESSGNLNAIGAHGEIGPYQIKWTTWEHFCADLDMEPERADLNDPAITSEVVAWALSTGYGRWWSTYTDEPQLPNWLESRIRAEQRRTDWSIEQAHWSSE